MSAITFNGRPTVRASLHARMGGLVCGVAGRHDLILVRHCYDVPAGPSMKLGYLGDRPLYGRQLVPQTEHVPMCRRCWKLFPER